MQKIIIQENACKGCGLCCWACPKNILELDKTRVNKKGFHPVTGNLETCNACTFCALICPDMAITTGGE